MGACDPEAPEEETLVVVESDLKKVLKEREAVVQRLKQIAQEKGKSSPLWTNESSCVVQVRQLWNEIEPVSPNWLD